VTNIPLPLVILYSPLLRKFLLSDASIVICVTGDIVYAIEFAHISSMLGSLKYAFSRYMVKLLETS